MPTHTYLCLFDLHAYDERVAPALRLYAHDYQPKAVVALLEDVIRRAPPGIEDYEHWKVSIEPDAGNKPSEQTLRELTGMLIRQFCLPMPPVQLDQFVPWLSNQSEWFADLMQGGEGLSGGSLEFPYGTGRLVATRQQIKHFEDEVTRIAPPEGDLAKEYLRLREMVARADGNASYTLLKTSLE